MQQFLQSKKRCISDTTTVRVGGDTCDIVSIDQHQIICRTVKPTFDLSTNELFIGGAGAKTYFFRDRLDDVSMYRDQDNENAFNTRLSQSGRYQWGYQQTGILHNYIDAVFYVVFFLYVIAARG